MPKKDKPILRTTQNQPETQPTKTDTTHQNHLCWLLDSSAQIW